MEPDFTAATYCNHLVKLINFRHISEFIQQEIYVSGKGQILSCRSHLDQRLIDAQDKNRGQSMSGVFLIRYL